MKMTFKWDHNRGEGKAKKSHAKDIQRTLNLDPVHNVMALDFLTDIIAQATKMYEEALAHQNKAIMPAPINNTHVFRETNKHGKQYFFINGRKTSAHNFAVAFNEAINNKWIDSKPTHIEDAGAIRLWKFEVVR